MNPHPCDSVRYLHQRLSWRTSSDKRQITSSPPSHQLQWSLSMSLLQLLRQAADLWIPAWIAIKGPIIFSKEALMSYVQFSLKNQSESQAGWTSPQMKNTNWCITISLRIWRWRCLLALQNVHVMMLTWNPIMLMCFCASYVWPLRYIIIQPSCLPETKTFCPKNIFIVKQ